MAFLVVVGGLQFLYCVAVGNYVCFSLSLSRRLWCCFLGGFGFVRSGGGRFVGRGMVGSVKEYEEAKLLGGGRFSGGAGF